MENGIYPVQLPIWDMFNWVGGTNAERVALFRSGRLPWWAASNVHLGVFRPLPSVLTHFDYATLDGLHHPWRMHVHSLLWWLLLVAGVAVLLGTLLPLPLAAISVGLYALDDGHVVPFAWAANRSELIAFAFVVWALWVEILAQRRGSTALRVLSGALVLLGLASGEHALAPLTYFVALFLLGSGSLWQRARKLVPLVVLVLVYSAVRARLGYGIAGSGFYIDPLSEPVRYVEACLTRVPILLGELVFSASSEWWFWGYPWEHQAWFRELLPQAAWEQSGVRVALVSLGIVAGLLSLAAVRWLAQADGRLGERNLRWLLLGALASLIPLSGTIVLGRMTVAPAIAFNALLAYVAWRAGQRVLERSGALWQRIGAGLVVLLIVELAVIEPAMRSRAGAHYMHGVTHVERRWVEEADYGTDDLSGKYVFVLSSRDMASQFSIPYIMHAAGRGMPEFATLLSPMGEKVQFLTRTGDNSFELLFPIMITRVEPFNGSVYRPVNDPLRAGDTISSVMFDVTVLRVERGQPSHLRFVFRRPVDDPSLIFMVANEHRLQRLEMPPIGERVNIRAAAGP